jgi:hypothetical protein
MYALSSSTAILAAMALALAGTSTPRFAMSTHGAVNLEVAGGEARYGLVPAEGNGGPMLVLSLGATKSRGALTLTMAGERMPARGRYPVQASWDGVTSGRAIHASFAAGSAERPLGWFEGESGWVTVTEAGAGQMSGHFEIRARGFTSAAPDEENRWVTVRGSFEAHGDSTITAIASIR